MESDDEGKLTHAKAETLAVVL